jgi:alpha-L-rhamnosidase
MPAGQERITFIKAHYDSVKGRIESAWDWREGKFTYSFTIPKGTTARVEFPLLNGSEEILLNGRSFTAAELGGEVLDGKAIFVLGAGSYVMQ